MVTKNLFYMQEILTIIALVLITVNLFFHNLKINRIMNTADQYNAVLNRIDTATTAIAQKVQSLEDAIKNAGLPAEQEQEFLSKIEGVASQLEAIGKVEEIPSDEGTGE